MDIALLLFSSIVKIFLVIGFMALVTAPSWISTTPVDHHFDSSRVGTRIGTSTRFRDHTSSMSIGGDDSTGHLALDKSRLIGTGTREIASDASWHDSDQDSHRPTPIDTDPFEHHFNIDGSSMCGDFDIHGNPFGVTDCHSDSWGCGDVSSMFD